MEADDQEALEELADEAMTAPEKREANESDSIAKGLTSWAAAMDSSDEAAARIQRQARQRQARHRAQAELASRRQAFAKRNSKAGSFSLAKSGSKTDVTSTDKTSMAAASDANDAQQKRDDASKAEEDEDGSDDDDEEEEGGNEDDVEDDDEEEQDEAKEGATRAESKDTGLAVGEHDSEPQPVVLSAADEERLASLSPDVRPADDELGQLWSLLVRSRQSLLEETAQLKVALNRAQQDLSAARTKDVMRIEKLAQSNTHLQSQLKELNGVVADIVTAKKAAFDKVARPALAGSGAGAKQVAKAKPKGKGLAR